MFILRAFPFSFSILWRYALVLPIMVLVFCVYAIIAVFFGFLFGVVSPALAALLALAVGLASSVIPAMVGTRIGLQALGVQPRNSYASLILPAIGYGLFEGFCVLSIMLLTLAAVTFATPFNFMELLSLNQAGADAAFARLLAENAPVTLAAFAVASFWVVAVRTALLVPFAGASVGIDPSGRVHTPFYGFGGGFWSILILVIISYIGSVVIIPIIAVLTQIIGLGGFFAEGLLQVEKAITEVEFDFLGAEALITYGLIILAMLWLFSLQCAGAVLVFHNRKRQYDIAREDYQKANEGPDEPPMPKTDMRELLRSRMPQNRR